MVWPWGRRSHGLTQAASEADWLRDWIFEKEGFRVIPQPIQPFPADGSPRASRGVFASVIVSSWPFTFARRGTPHSRPIRSHG